MPHLILEHSFNIPDQEVDFPKLFVDLHEELSKGGFCPIAAIKTRVVKHETCHIGDGDVKNAFVVLNVAVLNSRALPALQEKGRALHNILLRYFPKTYAADQQSVALEIREIEKNLYFV